MQNLPDIGPLLKEQRLAAIKLATTAFQSPLSHRSTHLRKEVGLSTRRVELVTPSGLVDVQAFSPTGEVNDLILHQRIFDAPG